MGDKLIRKRFIIPSIILIFFLFSLFFSGPTIPSECDFIVEGHGLLCNACYVLVEFNPLLRPVTLTIGKLRLIEVLDSYSNIVPCPSDSFYRYFLMPLDSIYWLLISYILYRVLKKYFSKNGTQASLRSRQRSGSLSLASSVPDPLLEGNYLTPSLTLLQ